MGSDWGEFWRRILRFNWFGHQSLFDLIPTFVVPCTTGHFASVATICSFLPVDQKLSQKNLVNCEPALTSIRAITGGRACGRDRSFGIHARWKRNKKSAVERTSCKAPGKSVHIREEPACRWCAKQAW